jgi:hypothetical protein
MASDEPKDESLSKKKAKKVESEKVSNQSELDPAIAKVIRDAMLVRLGRSNEKKEQINEIEAMYVTCQEFLKSFIILGYDLNGQPIPPLIHANNQQEADSLGSYLSKFIHHNIKEIDPSSE